MSQVVVITGGSSGIGLSTAKVLASKSCIVYEISRRNIVHTENIHHLNGDVTDEEKMKSLIQMIAKTEGKIDVLICCAGFGISGATEFTETEEAKQLLNVNLFGVVHCIRAVLPIMREQGYGKIMAISSVAAPISIPFQSWYSVSKAAISSYCAALREEVKPFGIQVCAILPGDISTEFTASRKKSVVGDDIYQGRITRSVSGMERDEQNGMSADVAGKYIAKLALQKHVKPYYAIGIAYKGAVLLSRFLPSSVLSNIVGKLYAK